MVAVVIVLVLLVVVLGYFNYKNINVSKNLANDMTLAKTAVSTLTTRATTAEKALENKLAAEGKAVSNVGTDLTKVL